jgi:hypothetical protein
VRFGFGGVMPFCGKTRQGQVLRLKALRLHICREFSTNVQVNLFAYPPLVEPKINHLADDSATAFGYHRVVEGYPPKVVFDRLFLGETRT